MSHFRSYRVNFLINVQEILSDESIPARQMPMAFTLVTLEVQARDGCEAAFDVARKLQDLVNEEFERKKYNED